MIYYRIFLFVCDMLYICVCVCVCSKAIHAKCVRALPFEFHVFVEWCWNWHSSYLVPWIGQTKTTKITYKPNFTFYFIGNAIFSLLYKKSTNKLIEMAQIHTIPRLLFQHSKKDSVEFSLLKPSWHLWRRRQRARALFFSKGKKDKLN